MMSGVSVCFSVSPLWPGWPPLLFLPFSRKEDVRGGFDSPSLDGGLELLLLFLLSRCSSSRIRASSRSIISNNDSMVGFDFFIP